MMGKIKEYIPFIRDRVVLKDRKDNEWFACFYIDKNIHIDRSSLCHGSTLFIRMAVHHDFIDGSRGIRCKDPSTCKVVKCGLQQLFQLDELRVNILNHTGPYTNGNKCAKCNKQEDGDNIKLSRCSACKLIAYCCKVSDERYLHTCHECQLHIVCGECHSLNHHEYVLFGCIVYVHIQECQATDWQVHKSNCQILRELSDIFSINYELSPVEHKSALKFNKSLMN